MRNSRQHEGQWERNPQHFNWEHVYHSKIQMRRIQSKEKSILDPRGDESYFSLLGKCTQMPGWLNAQFCRHFAVPHRGVSQPCAAKYTHPTLLRRHLNVSLHFAPNLILLTGLRQTGGFVCMRLPYLVLGVSQI